MTRDLYKTVRVLAEVLDERQRQEERWGEQNHPDGTGPTQRWELEPCTAVEAANRAREQCEIAAREGRLTWRDIAAEEFLEALAEVNFTELRKELVQLAAVLVAWVEAGDRRRRSW